MPENLPMNAVLRDFGACTIVRGVKVLKRELLHGNQLPRAAGCSYLGCHLVLRFLALQEPNMMVSSTALHAATIKASKFVF
jgi:hypothetical protein